MILKPQKASASFVDAMAAFTGCKCAAQTSAQPAVRRSGRPPAYDVNMFGHSLASIPEYEGYTSDVNLQDIGFVFTSPPYLALVAGTYRLPSNATYAQAVKAGGGWVEEGDVLSFDVYVDPHSRGILIPHVLSRLTAGNTSPHPLVRRVACRA